MPRKKVITTAGAISDLTTALIDERRELFHAMLDNCESCDFNTGTIKFAADKEASMTRIAAKYERVSELLKKVYEIDAEYQNISALAIMKVERK